MGEMGKKRDAMNFEPKTIAQHIKCLARLTGAPESFVSQVRNLFSSKGISLDSDATPYVGALDEAFTREESIRANTRRARRSMARVQSNFKKIGEAYVEQLQQMGHRNAEPAAEQSDVTEIIVDGDHRSLVTPLQSEHFPMVPGPEDPQ
jgi:hypothetical protein